MLPCLDIVQMKARDQLKGITHTEQKKSTAQTSFQVLFIVIGFRVKEKGEVL